MTTGRLALAAVVLAAATLGSTGCVRRTLTITSEPSGALVTLNDREIGRTPVEVEFLWYGNYDVRLSLDGHEPLVTSGRIRSPLWDTMPLDLGAEILPGTYEVRRSLHYVLEPAIIDDESLVERASRMRDEVRALPLPEPDADPSSDAG